MFKKTQIIYCAILLLGSFSITGQKLLKKAEMQMENGDFHLAVESLKNYLKSNPDDVVTISKIADAYSMSGELTEAIHWYETIPGNTLVDPVTLKRHGDVLKKLGRYKEAIVVYQKYRLYKPNEADHFIGSCEFAISTLSGEPTFETFVMPSNSNSSDFGLTFYHSLPVFSSFRNDILMTESEKLINTEETAHRSFLYNAEKNRLGFIKAMDGSMNHIGPLSFSSNGLRCALIESKIEDRYAFVTTGKMSSLHIAIVNEKGEITSTRPFQYNEVGSSINSANLAFDGTAIYFSSDRKGGFGGFDIYVSYLDNGEWSLPMNLGDEINSQENEITPFLKGNELYFASDYHTGLGGYDIFKSEVINGIWTNPKNLGLGANSLSDDYSPTFNSMGELYFTSDRLGGKGKNDIYKSRKLMQEEPISEEFASIPQAVSLDALADETQKHTVNADAATMVTYKESELNTETAKANNSTIFKLPEFDVTKVGSNAMEDMSLEGAHRIGFSEQIPSTEVFFIQLASVSKVKPNFDRFKILIKYGNIYKMSANNSLKVRLGYFTDRKEAEDILAKVRASGFKDSFIT
ncbi:MAG: PD40 domain-containing protein, partial [Saprospiraceae bacterium]|nr:PD40 domain-containing protein [Saprospiraceae bacterium]